MEKPPFGNHSGLANWGSFWRTKRSSSLHAPEAWLGGTAPTETSLGCESAELPLPVAVPWPCRVSDRCHTPDKKLQRTNAVSVPCVGMALITLGWSTSGGKCQEGLVSSRSCATGALRQQLLAGSWRGWLSQACATRLECGNASRGEEATPGSAQGNKNSKRKRSSCRKTLAALPNGEVPSGTSDPNGSAPFRLFIP